MLKEVIDQVETDKAILTKPTDGLRPKAPGMKYRHYAPKADFRMYDGEEEKVANEIIKVANEKDSQGYVTGILTSDQNKHFYEGKVNDGVVVVSLGDLDKPETIANHLFKALRDFDKMEAQFIFGETFSRKNVGDAIMNRLTKAAGYNIINL